MCFHRMCWRRGEHPIQYLSTSGVDVVMVCSRHKSKARKLARHVGGEPIYHFLAWESGMAPLTAWRVLRLPPRPSLLDPSERVEASGIAEIVGLLATQPTYKGTAIATDRRILIVDQGIAHHKVPWSQVSRADTVSLPGNQRGLLLSILPTTMPGYDLGIRPADWDPWMRILRAKGVSVGGETSS